MAASGLLIGNEIFRAYDDAKKKFKDFDTWVAEAIRDEFGEDMVAPLMSAKIAKTSRLPWDNPIVFENIALTLNGRPVLPDVDQDISVKELAFAVTCLKKEFPNDEFDDKVIQYFAAEAGEEGIAILPPELKDAQRFIPPIFLNKEQQSIQRAYLEEIKDYIEIMTSASIAGGGDK
jgi:hypothetical protein|nr:MAG TPA: hypothetical protein [Caudoviricetes sp.]